MKKILTLVTACIGLSSIGAQAAIQYEQNFGGTDGDLDGQLGWIAGSSPDIINVAGAGVFSLGTPTDYNTNGSISNVNGVARGAVNVDAEEFRNTAYADVDAVGFIDFDANDEIWVSYSASNIFGFAYENDLIVTNSSFATIFRFGFRDDGIGGGDGVFGAQAGMTGTTADANGAGDVTFILGKITTSAAGLDTFDFRTYSTTDTIGSAAAWTAEATASGTITGTGAHLYLRMAGIADNTSQVDRIVFGDTFADVTGVPEPSSYALLAGMLALGAVMIRRRK